MNSTSHTEVVIDFDENFRICRAFNSKNIDKKIFLKSFHFDQDKSKILKMVKIDMHKNIDFLEKFHI